MDTVAEAEAIGLEEMFFGNDICIIEWAERIVDMLPTERLWVTLRYVDHTKRELKFEAHGARSASVLERLRREAFGV